MTKITKPKVLIVDDTPSNILVLNEILKDLDCALLSAGSGKEALRIARSELPDLILLDVVMKGLDGYEVCRRLKSDIETSDIPVIFITAFNEGHDDAHGFEVGAVDYISKPVKPAIVIARVKNHLKLKQQQDMLASLSATDFLTGVANRRRFDVTITEEVQRCVLSGKPLSIALCDIDFFKQYNDTYNHLAGDLCLKDVATTIREVASRDRDLVARFGGEEFIMVLPDTDTDTAIEMANRVCEKVNTLKIYHAESKVDRYVTISVGIATLRSTDDCAIAQPLIEAADQALYLAKEKGRNRVEVATFQQDLNRV